jgi:hypothetical protein
MIPGVVHMLASSTSDADRRSSHAGSRQGTQDLNEQLLADHPLLSSLQLWAIQGLATRLHYRLAHRFYETQVMQAALTSSLLRWRWPESGSVNTPLATLSVISGARP